MSKDKIKSLYEQLLEAGGLPGYMTGEWEKDEKEFTKQFNLDGELLDFDIEIEDEFDEGFYNEY